MRISRGLRNLRTRKTLVFVVSFIVATVITGCASTAASPTLASTATKAPALAATPTLPPAPTSTATPAPTSTPRPKEKVSLRLQWLVGGSHPPFFLALDKGYFADEGFDVEILEGKGSVDTARVVATKQATFGLTSSTAVMAGVQTGMPIKMVVMPLRKGMEAVLVYDESGIRKPKDLEGKTIAVVTGSSDMIALPGLFKAGGVDESKVNVVTTDNATMNTLFISGKVDGAVTWVLSQPLLEQRSGKKVIPILHADYGFNLMGLGLVAHNDTIKEKPDMVRRFVAAIIKGWEYSKNNPKEAFQVLMKYAEKYQAKPEEAQFTVSLGSMDSARTKGKPTGWMDKSDWEEAQSGAYASKMIESTRPVEEYYTNDFLPK